MFHYLFGSMFLIFTIMCFNQEYAHKGVLNAYLGLYKGVVESCVVAYTDTGTETTPYFNLTLVNQALSDYFEKNLSPYARSYTYSVYYPKKIWILPDMSEIKIDLKAVLNDIYTFERVAYFKVKKVR